MTAMLKTKYESYSLTKHFGMPGNFKNIVVYVVVIAMYY